MKIIFLTNNEITSELFDWLNNKENLYVKKYQNKINIEKTKQYNPGLIISYNYRFIIDKKIIDYMNGKIINLHISYLPWNKGAHPNVWSHLEETKSGVTIHKIDPKIDTGDILFQKEIKFNSKKESLKSSYNKLHKEIQNLFKRNWDSIKDWDVEAKTQIEKGTFHKSKDFQNIKHLLGEEGWDINIKKLKERYSRYKKKGE